MMTVHKQTVTKVPNAKAGRDSTEWVIEGMSGGAFHERDTLLTCSSHHARLVAGTSTVILNRIR